MEPTAVDKADRMPPGGAATAFDSNAAHTQPAESLTLLVGELQHRIRNLLTVVQCFVNHTDSATPDGYRAALTARIAALSDAYNLIDRAREHRISLIELLERTLNPFAAARKDRVHAAGPDVELEPRLALPLHMIVHELASNASKHGALSSSSGRVEVFWNLLRNDGGWSLAMQWSEHGGPEVSKPKHRGFGLRLITKVLTDARVEMEFAPAGVVCRVLIEPIDR
jgi:two-component sensor histidine kinase